jgi:hypothetical protein
VRPAPKTLLSALLVLTGCRAFPVGLYVPDEVLTRLAETRYVEDLDEAGLARELAERAGRPLDPAPPSPARYFRLDLAPPRGPFAPAAFDVPGGEAAAGLCAGDLVLLVNPKAQSLATTLTFENFTFHDHLGVLIEREGRLLVCDSWPRFHPFAKASDFADRFRGGVRATPLGRFLAHYESARVLRPADPAGAPRLAAAALASLDEGIEFDPHHDPADPRLSCSEYVQLLFARAGLASPASPRAARPDAELHALLGLLGFPSTGFVVPDQFAELAGLEPVAWISRHPSAAAAHAKEAAFRVLHARARAGDRVADFLAVDRFRFLRYRANVRAFLRWAEAWGAARGTHGAEPLAAELEELAPLFFRRASLSGAGAPP